MTSGYNAGDGQQLCKGGQNLGAFVKNLRGEALMPCPQRKARILIKKGKAEITSCRPFTTRLLYPTGETVQRNSTACGYWHRYRR